MTIEAVLLLYVTLLISAGPKVLTSMTASGNAPRLGIAAWLTAIITVLGCSIAATVLLLIESAGHWDSPDALLASCLERLQAILLGHGGWTARAIATAAVTLVSGYLVAIGTRLARALVRMRAHTFAHADGVRLVGKSYGDDIVIIDAAEPAAYCVAGRRPAIVVTTAALAALNEAQLAAVVAHERAHLGGRHAYVVAAVRGLAAALPRVRLLTSASAQITFLLELCADDAAAHRHGRQPLLSGLLTLTGAAAPAHGLAAASVAVLVRAQRLSAPQIGFAQLRAYLTLSGAVTAMLAIPTGIVALWISGTAVCFA